MAVKDSVDHDKIKMNVFEAVATRRSVRKYTIQDIPMEILGVVLDAGRYAPSAGNIQNWRFIIVKDPENKQAIAEASMQQMWMAEAPVIVVVVSEMEKIKQFYGVRGERLFSIQNCAAAVQNMLLTAHSLGLASTWVGAFDENMINRALSIPGDVRVQAVLPFGYPDEVVPAPTRYTMENVCFFESYGSRITNIKRVMHNPVIFDKLRNMIAGFAGPIKETLDKRKEKK